MLSFLVDNLCFLGGDRSSALAQGNQPPIAVDDPFTVIRGAGPVTISVLGNDIDPEGQPLTVVSAFAALGSAVAEADNTVTYTPPQGEAAATADFDTVTYEIEDVEGARDTGQIDITISDPAVTIATLPDNTFEVSAGNGTVDVVVTDPPAFAGTYQADVEDLASGPVALAPPVISGTLDTGEVLTASAGLWIYGSAATPPSQGWQWQRDGVDIAGETGASYMVQAGDIGMGIRVVETLTDAFGTRSALSNTLGAFAPSDDAELVGWWDADDPATLTESGGAVSVWAGKAGPDLTQANGARQPTTGVRTLGGRNVLDFDGGDYFDALITLPVSGDVAFHMVVVIDSTASAFEAILSVEAANDFQIDANNAAQFDGRLNTTGIGSSAALTGGPFSGARVLSVVCDFTVAGQIEVFVDGVSRAATAYTTPIDAAAALYLMTNRSRNASVNGAVAECIVSGDVANRGDYHAYLAAKWGLS